MKLKSTKLALLDAARRIHSGHDQFVCSALAGDAAARVLFESIYRADAYKTFAWFSALGTEIGTPIWDAERKHRVFALLFAAEMAD